jgi:hypothetical protein
MKPLVLFGLAPLLGVPAFAQAALLGRLYDPDPVKYEGYASSVAFSGERMLVGVQFDSDRGRGAGAAQVYERDGVGGWVHVTKLEADDGSTEDYFGGRVALDGDWALVGATGDDEPTHNSGSVYAFQRQPNGAWIQRQKIAPQQVGSEFGTSLAVQGRRALIAATYELAGDGHVYVYERDASDQWLRVADLVSSDPFPGNWFGWSVALDGDRALIGAYGDAVAIFFERDSAGHWLQVQRVRGHDTVFQDRFGHAVALAGDHALIGAFEAHTSVSGSGAVYAFTRSTSWTETQKIVPADADVGDRFGDSLAIDGRRAVIADELDNYGSPFTGGNAGSAYCYALDSGGSWVQSAKLYSTSPSVEARFGRCVALKGDDVIIGAVRENTVVSLSGAVFLFDAEPLSVDKNALERTGSGGRAWAQPPSQALDLDAGPAYAGLLYQVLGSLSGTAPGISLTGGLHLPLNPDAYFSYTLNPSGRPLVNSIGVLDANGRARASLELGRVPLALIGQTFHHAFVVNAAGQPQALFVSNAQPLRLGP